MRLHFTASASEIVLDRDNDIITACESLNFFDSLGEISTEVRTMANTEVIPRVMPEDAVKRNITLTGKLMNYLLKRPQIFDSLPDNFELIILPDDDPEMRQYNLELLDSYAREDKPLVFVRMKSSQATDFEEARPSLYVPLAV
jgi:hypothetical protein